MKRILLFLFLYITTVFAEELSPFLNVEADLFKCSQDTIEMCGHVFVEHEMGKIKAEQITTSLKNHFSRVYLKDQVEILLKDKGWLSCVSASVDTIKKEGLFCGILPANAAIYCDPPLTFYAGQFHASLLTEETIHTIDSIVGTQDIKILYQPEEKTSFEAKGNELHYQRLENGGIATILGACTLSDQKGSRIFSNQMVLRLPEKTIALLMPKGTLFPQQKTLSFSSDLLVWDSSKNNLTLEKNVIIQDKMLGTLTTDQHVNIQMNDKNVCKSIECQGLSVLNHLDNENKYTHTIVCHGQIYIDQENKTTFLNSPTLSNGTVLQDSQVYFHDPFGKIHANTLTIYYRDVQGKILPEKVILEGNVKIDSEFQETEEAVKQYALADKAEYLVENKQLMLSSNAPSRVLFYDSIHQLQVSAPALYIRRDQVTQKESIQGVGDVRFQFVNDELAQMLEKFQLK